MAEVGWATARAAVVTSGSDTPADTTGTGAPAAVAPDGPVDGVDRFGTKLAAIAAAALVLRVALVLVNRNQGISNDGYFYVDGANLLVDGKAFVNPLTLKPLALHPPAWYTVLALPSLLGLETVLQHQLFACLLGAATVALVGLAAVPLAGKRVALYAAGLAAAYPNLWLHERELGSEVLAILLAAVVVILAYRHHRSPRLVNAVLLGVACGVLALTRSEQALLLPLLVLPLVWLAGRDRIGQLRRAAWIAAAGVAAVLVVAPWSIYNTSRFEKRVLLSTNFGMTARIANCPEAYEGPRLGYFDERCYFPLGLPEGDESVTDPWLVQRSIDFARNHAGQVPAVLAARQGRTWSVFRPFQQMRFDQEFGRGAIWIYQSGLVAYWVLVPFAVLGGIVLRRRRVLLLPLLALLGVVVVATFVTLGQTRIRAPGEIAIVLLAAVGIDVVVRWRSTGRWELA